MFGSDSEFKCKDGMKNCWCTEFSSKKSIKKLRCTEFSWEKTEFFFFENWTEFFSKVNWVFWKKWKKAWCKYYLHSKMIVPFQKSRFFRESLFTFFCKKLRFPWRWWFFQKLFHFISLVFTKSKQSWTAFSHKIYL